MANQPTHQNINPLLATTNTINTVAGGTGATPVYHPPRYPDPRSPPKPDVRIAAAEAIIRDLEQKRDEECRELRRKRRAILSCPSVAKAYRRFAKKQCREEVTRVIEKYMAEIAEVRHRMYAQQSAQGLYGANVATNVSLGPSVNTWSDCL